MRNKRSKSKAQVTVEYAFLMFIAVGVLAGMTVYVKRALQARIRDSREIMVATVRNYNYTDPLNGDVYFYNGLIYKEYEPYYGNRYSEVYTVDSEVDTLLPGLTTGISRKTIDHTTWSKTKSEQLPPGASD